MNPRTRVKICGITRPQDGVAAAALGVDAIGLVFYAKSPRNISIERANEICAALPGFVTVVSLFLNPDAEWVDEVLADVPVDLIQFHGAEPGDFCRSFNRPYIKVLGMSNADLPALAADYADARGLLLDSHATGEAGGSGKTFDWQVIPEAFRRRIILAGGLNPDNIGAAIREVRPYAVDLSSGVESAPGIKDVTRMTRLMNEVKRVDCETE
ncbi:MAG: phosphoribosylanthranilate isomerase [Gammaproteobacteria bacterium]|nr:phosphoribosylanthranilate isomerase [Gammaproteobacteria bacterium]